MITSIRNWVVAIVVISIVLALFDAITPENSAGRFANLCGSLILTFVVISPIVDFNFSDDIFDRLEYNNSLIEYVEQRVQENNKLEVLIIEKQTTEYN